MILTDTHSHLYSDQFKEDIDQVIDRCFQEGVKRIFLPNIDLDSINPMLELEQRYPNNVFPMMGLHPCSVKEDYISVLNELKGWIDKRNFVAIGEIGIDLFWDKSLIEEQKKAFEIQIGWAKELKKPIIIHARDSFDEIFEIVERLNDDSLTGIFHCFTGDLEQATRVINLGGFYLGIGGVATFKNSHLPALLPKISLKHIVIETDSPYLAPTPFRGKRNESSYVKLIAVKLAEIYNTSLGEIAETTTNNSKTIFGI